VTPTVPAKSITSVSTKILSVRDPETLVSVVLNRRDSIRVSTADAPNPPAVREMVTVPPV
jgi:hypothetical protein